MTPDTAAQVAASVGFVVDRPPTRLVGGHLNWVFRVRRGRHRAILKVAPPHVASRPDIPLDPRRSRQERRGLARAAEVLGPSRVPLVLGYDDERHVLLLEDLDRDGDGADLLQGLSGPGPGVDRLLEELGDTIGELHRATWGDEDRGLANPAVQATRFSVQYEPVPGWLAARGYDPELGRAAVGLGAWLREARGRCLVMGDLWPASVWVRGDGSWALFDWELCHHGQPLQDVAHLRAHLWLAAPDAATAAAWRARFDDAYAGAGPVWDRQQVRGAQLHEGAELLARSVGAFPLFPFGDPRIDESVARAVRLMKRAGGG